MGNLSYAHIVFRVVMNPFLNSAMRRFIISGNEAYSMILCTLKRVEVFSAPSRKYLFTFAGIGYQSAVIYANGTAQYRHTGRTDANET